MKKPKGISTFATVPESGIIAIDPKFWANVIKLYAGKRIEVNVSLYKESAGHFQHKHYRGKLLPIATNCIIDAGHIMTSDQVHKMLKRDAGYIEEVANPMTGEISEDVRSMSDFSYGETEAFIKWVEGFLKDFFNVTIEDDDGIEKLTF